MKNTDTVRWIQKLWHFKERQRNWFSSLKKKQNKKTLTAFRVLQKLWAILRTLPTKYKGFFARLGQRRKVNLYKGYWNPQRKIWVAKHFFEIIILELNKNAAISIFLKKQEKDISSQIFLEFALTYRKADKHYKIFKLHGKWLHKNYFWYVFTNKIVAKAPLASLTTLLWFS